MSTWAIGDIHGCHRTLMALLARVDFRPGRDHLWLVGDIVNRGTGSLETLAWAYAQRAHLTMVLGNHELYLLMVADKLVDARRDDTLGAILAHPMRAQWLAWLSARPWVHPGARHLMVHAGFLPSWDRSRCLQVAGDAQAALSGSGRQAFLRALAARPHRLDAPGLDGLAAAARAMTQVRMVDAAGVPAWGHVGRPEAAAKGTRAWFAGEARWRGDDTVVFGHWSSLGRVSHRGVEGIDSGCVWGRALTAMCLEDGRCVSVPCQPGDGPRLPGAEG